jgi:putative transposase
LSHTYASNRVHVVFSTKHRQKRLAPEIQPRLWGYMSGIARNHGFEALKIGGVEDHVHALLIVPPNMALSKAVQILKGSSSKHLNETLPRRGFNWQEGYGAFSVSCSQTQSVVNYIANQPSHHCKQTYDEEFLEFLEKHASLTTRRTSSDNGPSLRDLKMRTRHPSAEGAGLRWRCAPGTPSAPLCVFAGADEK